MRTDICMHTQTHTHTHTHTGFSIEQMQSDSDIIAKGQQGFSYMIGNVTKGSQVRVRVLVFFPRFAEVV